jgi:hypothetical protein
MSQIENRLKTLGFTLPPPFPVPDTMQSYMSMAHIIGHRCIISCNAALNPDGSNPSTSQTCCSPYCAGYAWNP